MTWRVNTGPTTAEAIARQSGVDDRNRQSEPIRVVLASILPISDYETRDGKPIIRTTQRPPEKIKALNEWIIKYVGENKLTYLDYYQL